MGTSRIDELWNEGIGYELTRQVVLIKTGTVNGTSWTFSNSEISKSIDHAVAPGADVILLGMCRPVP